MNNKFECGDKLEEKVTGFKGIVMAYTYYSTGCIHYGLLSRKLKDGAEADYQWFDESRLILSKGKVINFERLGESTGGPVPNAPKM